MRLAAFYDHWVNGEGLSTRQLLLRATCTDVPEIYSTEPAGSTPRTISVPRSDHVVVPQLCDAALRPVECVLLHGSQATADTCDFSDVDIVVVLDDAHPYSLEEHRAAISELRRLLAIAYSYDPLMHHGLMFLPASRLSAYDETYLPLESIRCGRVLYGTERLTFRLVRPDEERLRASVQNSAQSLRFHFSSGSSWDDYRFKRVLAGVLLLPARVCALSHRFVYKRESFELAREMFSAGTWSGILRAQEFRLAWVRPPRDILGRTCGHLTHPAATIRWTIRRSPTRNARKLLLPVFDRWRAEIERALQRVEELAA
jgi:hypothetical protein